MTVANSLAPRPQLCRGAETKTLVVETDRYHFGNGQCNGQRLNTQLREEEKVSRCSHVFPTSRREAQAVSWSVSQSVATTTATGR